MKRLFQFLLVVALPFIVNAQKQLLTMEDAMLNIRTTLAPETLKGIQFIDGSEDYVYLKQSGSDREWVKGSMKSGETSFLSLAEFNAALKQSGLETFDSWPSLRFEKDAWYIKSLRGEYRVFPKQHQYQLILSKELMNKPHVERGNAGYIAYVDNWNLFVTGNGQTHQVTTDGSEDIVYASSVHREEFGITKGTFWSPSGNQLAFYRMDQSMVADYPIIDWSVSPAKNHNIKYPMAGGTSHHVTVGVYTPSSNQLIYLNTGGPADKYLTNIAWTPDEKYILIAVLNREQNHMWMNKYDSRTGKFVSTVFEEEDPKYVEPLHPALFLPNHPDQFIWQSQRDGWNHLYLYDLSGKLLKQLTSGSWEVVSVDQFDAKGNRLFFVSTKRSPISRNLQYIDLKTGKISDVTHDDFVHKTTVSSDGRYVIDNFSSTENPGTIRLIDISKNKSKQLLQAPDPLSSFEKAQLKLFTLQSTDGQPLYHEMFLPINFDSTKKYPVIVYWYGGPHAQLVLNSWNGGGGNYWFQYMAQRGYLVLCFDTRGSDNRGRDFEQVIFRNLGDAEMDDMMTTVHYLSTLRYADTSRMGLFGWSFGGFMTTNFLINHPGIYKAAVAGGAVTNWAWYEVMYGERYMDTPQENPKGYTHTNLVLQAGKLKDKLLLIHGLQDPVVLQQHTVDFVKSAVDHKVQIDYMIYPGHEHNVLGKDRAHLYQKVTDYLIENINCHIK